MSKLIKIDIFIIKQPFVTTLFYFFIDFWPPTNASTQ